MKKITLSVAALAIAISSYGQSYGENYRFGVDSTITSTMSLQAKGQHENLYQIVIRAEDMKLMLEEDVNAGFVLDGMDKFYRELLTEIIKLASNTRVDCENCDEID